jgi:Protein of unknown function (DUF2380)
LGDRLRAASQAGAQILIIGIVHKQSTLVQVAWAVAVDTTSQRVLFRKFFTFRGDNDEGWQRAERFVSEEVRDRLLESRSQQQAARVCNGRTWSAGKARWAGHAILLSWDRDRVPHVSRIAKAQSYPTRPITMIMPFTPGGDAIGRIVGERMRRSVNPSSSRT